jgi:hypothetical protein
MTFDPFGDFETAGYLQNSLQLKDPVEVKPSLPSPKTEEAGLSRQTA